MTSRAEIIEWLEGPEGVEWKRNTIAPLPTHFASLKAIDEGVNQEDEINLWWWRTSPGTCLRYDSTQERHLIADREKFIREIAEKRRVQNRTSVDEWAEFPVGPMEASNG